MTPTKLPSRSTTGTRRASVAIATLATAATGLFQQDHPALPLPTLDAPDRGETVLVWGGSSSVGSNAIQLARCAGYRVITTVSPHNFDYVRSLGAAAAVDYHNKGILAVSPGSVVPAVAIAHRTTGTTRIAAAQPALMTRLQLLRSRTRGGSVSSIWGGTLKDNEVGPGMFIDFLPAALAAGIYRAAPKAEVVGTGLEQIPIAINQLRHGVSAQKLVVRV
jgi:NADPH:quinone reductase-like Zn-dependent oxidoreductase